jgi:hypothetical protein
MINFNAVADDYLRRDRTPVLVQINLRSGDDYRDGILKPTKARDAWGLDVEYTVREGKDAKRKIFGYVMVEGTTEGQKGMIEGRSLPFLKGVLNSAYFLDPADQSPAACAKRQVEAWRDFDGLCFLAEIGVEKGKDGYPDKNVVTRAITRDMPQWNGRAPIEQVGLTGGGGPTGSGAAPAPAPMAKPKWAE